MKLLPLLLTLAAGAAVVLTGLFPISAQPAKRYEVATIKPANDCANPRPGSRGGAGADGIFRMNCVTLASLIVIAYEPPSGGVVTTTSRRTPVEEGPGWMRSQQFDIVAQAQGNPTQVDMRGPMLQALLEDRFQLVVGREVREGSVYFLTVDRGGLKIQPRTEPCAPQIDSSDPEAMKQLKAQLKAKAKMNIVGVCGMRMGQSGQNRVVEFNGTTMSEFAKNLGLNETDRPVLDRTGRAERFNIRLEYSKDVVAPGGAATDPPTGPSLFTALQEQLGLRLENGRGPTDVLVVDRAERPSEN